MKYEEKCIDKSWSTLFNEIHLECLHSLKHALDLGPLLSDTGIQITFPMI